VRLPDLQRKHLMKKPGVNIPAEIICGDDVRLEREIDEYEIKYERRDAQVYKVYQYYRKKISALDQVRLFRLQEFDRHDEMEGQRQADRE